MKTFGHDIACLTANSRNFQQVRKTDLATGDWILIRTRNSTYRIRKIDRHLYRISGGWFDKKGLSPIKMPINGCTRGGRIIKTDLVAACGLCLEFGNRLQSSPIKKIIVIKGEHFN